MAMNIKVDWTDSLQKRQATRLVWFKELMS